MADLIIPDFDDAVLIRLKRRAWEQGLPLAESLRRCLIASLEIEEGQPEPVPHAYCRSRLDGRAGHVSLYS
jgi:hypothetical protein